MNALLTVLAGEAIGFAVWELARSAARSRGITTGRWPVFLALVAPLATAADCATGSHAPLLALLAPGIASTAIVDLQTGYLFDRATLGLAAFAVLAAFAGAGALDLLGALVAGGLPALLYFGSRARALGLGDVKLLAAIGLVAGPLGGLVVLGYAVVAGGLAGAVLLALRRKRRGDTVPFGPALAAGTLLALAYPYTNSGAQ